MNLPLIDARLMRASKFIGRHAYVADIGTDHAYLPIYLILTGKAKNALASDINDGPVEHAKQSVSRFDVADRVEVIKAAGLEGVGDRPVTDIVIAGMGGELIASIMDDEPKFRHGRYNFVLQPMTHPEILRMYLNDSGFSIIDEDVVSDMQDENGKVYQIINAIFTGESEEYTAPELYFGKHNIKRGGEEFIRLCQREARINRNIINAKKSAGQNADTEAELLVFAEKYINMHKRGQI